MRRFYTKHHGHDIHYDEGTDLWECRDVNLTNDTLKGLKNAIDRFRTKAKKIKGIPCYVVNDYSDSFDVGEITSGPFEESGYHKEPYFWVNVKEKGRATKRRKIAISSLAIPSKADTAIAIWRAENNAASERRREADRLYKAIPRLKLEDVKALKGVSAEV
jgi:hypothetical protein